MRESGEEIGRVGGVVGGLERVNRAGGRGWVGWVGGLEIWRVEGAGILTEFWKSEYGEPAPMARIELATSPLPRERSATELHGRLAPPGRGG